ncbi:hypothetical protein LTS14_004390 [Recurvomyces mirabilis]|uniref:uncharacterized protein n=1 Tax=Recurvomyces mirabilis TaxID=574656 RepID=UPI002DE0C8B4|nr:hypothetical protein LTS14_004390 [Recurvomyces mirabilis]
MDRREDLPGQDTLPEAGLQQVVLLGGLSPVNTPESWRFLEVPSEARPGLTEQANHDPTKPLTARTSRKRKVGRQKKSIETKPFEPTANEAAWKEAAEDVIDRFDRLRTLRNEALDLRDQASYNAQQVEQQRRLLQVSQQQLMDDFVEAMSEVQLLPRLAKIQLSFQAVLDDSRSLSEHSATLQATQDEVTGLMSRLDTEDPSLRDAVNGLRRVVIGEQIPDTIQSTLMVDQASGANRVDEVHPVPDPLLTWFQDCLGEVQIMRERRGRLVWDHTESVVHRNFQSDHEHPVEPPDDVFEEEYRSSLEQTENDIDKAMRGLDQARETCNQNGISTEKHELAAESWFAEMLRTPTEVQITESLMDLSELDLEDKEEILTPEMARLATIDPETSAQRTQRKDNAKLRINDWIDLSVDQAAPTAQERTADFLARVAAVQPSILSTRSSPTLVPAGGTLNSDFLLDRAHSEPQITRAGSTSTLRRHFSESHLSAMTELFLTRQEAVDELRAANLP